MPANFPFFILNSPFSFHRKDSMDMKIMFPGTIPVSSSVPPVRANNYSPLQKYPTGTARTIGSMVRGFKIGVTQWYRQRSVPSKI
jgi:hypothetical protein